MPPKKRTAEVLEKGSEEDEAVMEPGTKDVEDSSHWLREEILPVPLVEGQQYLKIMSWNVNGLKALVTTKKAILLALVESRQPDVLCLQVKRSSCTYNAVGRVVNQILYSYLQYLALIQLIRVLTGNQNPRYNYWRV